MIIYVDSIIITNIIVNYLIIKSINVVFKDKTNLLLLLIGLLISVLSLLLFFLPYLVFNIIRYFVGIFIGLIVFLKDTNKSKIIKIIIYYLLNIAFIGSLVIFNVKNVIFLYLSLFLIIIMWILENYKSLIIKEKKYIYDIYINKQKIKAYLDSGNQVYVDGIPVVFLKPCYYNQCYTLYKEIEIKGILNQKEKYDVYKGPLLFMGKIEYIVYYVFVDHINKEVLLNFEMGEKND